MRRTAIDGCHGIFQLNPACDDRGKIGFRGNTKLDIDIGKAKIAVDQQRSLTGLCHGACQRDRHKCLTDATFARSDGDDRLGRIPQNLLVRRMRVVPREQSRLAVVVDDLRRGRL